MENVTVEHDANDTNIPSKTNWWVFQLINLISEETLQLQNFTEDTFKSLVYHTNCLEFLILLRPRELTGQIAGQSDGISGTSEEHIGPCSVLHAL